MLPINAVVQPKGDNARFEVVEEHRLRLSELGCRHWHASLQLFLNDMYRPLNSIFGAELLTQVSGAAAHL